MSKARGLADLGNVYNDGALSNRNLIINGAMQVAQRGTSVAGVTVGDTYRTVDRFKVGTKTVGTWTITQDTDAPVGFANSLKLDCTAINASADADDYLYVSQQLEGQDLQQLEKGTATAQSVTLSFWVKCNKIGTAQANLWDQDNTRLIGETFTIDVADTWEKKAITFAGDTTGSFNNDNETSLKVSWWLDAGSSFTEGAVPTSWEDKDNTDRAAGVTLALADNTANYLNITGVQLEVGDTATPFEHRSYGQELALCQRYYERVGNWSNGSRYYAYPVYRTRVNCLGYPVHYRVQKRVNPSVTTYSSGLETTGVFTQINGGSNLAILYGPDGDQNGLYRSQHATDPVSGLGYGLKIEADAEL